MNPVPYMRFEATARNGHAAGPACGVQTDGLVPAPSTVSLDREPQLQGIWSFNHFSAHFLKNFRGFMLYFAGYSVDTANIFVSDSNLSS
jgi:hypothetical protein